MNNPCPWCGEEMDSRVTSREPLRTGRGDTWFYQEFHFICRQEYAYAVEMLWVDREDA